jgi:CarboxypepD_reg-like domain/TonB-dependent Receptor Plug Domain
MTQPQIRKTGLLFLIFAMSIFSSTAQLKQTIRGTVVDNVLQTPLAGATITVSGSGKSTVSDEKGLFRLTNVSVGLQTLTISYVGYIESAVNNIVVNAGKEVVLTIPLQQNTTTENVIIIKRNSKKNKPLNDMSVVSARAFTVEETQKYAAALNDPLRMVTNFAGVASADDGNNNIVIRGNAPTGLLWRMEGIDIPNPNHFSTAGSSGGGISILSAQLLANSDFITGAFAAEYGNALSGVFDLKLRKGNNEKREYTFQAGLLGINGAAEGPLAKGYKGSYLINYRYSTLSLLDKLGLLSNSGAITNFQDVSYNIALPTKHAGNFTLFGFSGLSSQQYDPKKDSAKWLTDADKYGGRFISNTTLAGTTHSISLGRKTNLSSALAFSVNDITSKQTFIEKNYTFSNAYQDKYKTKKAVLSTTLNHKFNAANILRTGAILSAINFNYYQLSKENINAPLKEIINTNGTTETIQLYAQWQKRFSKKITANAGFHYLGLLYNHTSSFEPRASVKWDASAKSSFALGYGLHSQVQALGVYFTQQQNAAGIISYPNKNLAFTRAHHFVFSYNRTLTNNLKLKTEVYYQQLFDVPVSTSDTNTFSTLNVQENYVSEALVNKGKGKNYGIEVSLEKYLSKNYYFMFSNSLYTAKYKAADGLERNTKYNGGYISNFIGGKEFVSSGSKKVFGINIKFVLAGGYRTTPIDVAGSAANGYTIFKNKEAFSLQNEPYFRNDIRLSMKWNKRHATSTLSLDIQNTTSRKNIYDKGYDALTGKVITYYQNGLIPILNYKIEF